MSYGEESFATARRRLVEELRIEGYLHDADVERAMLTVPRHRFLPRYIRQNAYNDSPLSIMRGQTISAPHMVAMMCELISPSLVKRLLEVGSGTGYHACVCAEAMGRQGIVYSLEIDRSIPCHLRCN